MSVPYAKKEYLSTNTPKKVTIEKTRFRKNGRNMVMTMKKAMSL